MNSNHLFSYFLQEILDQGQTIDTRNSITKRCIAQKAVFFETPLVTLRKTAWKNALREMEWFLSGSDNLDQLHPSVHKWWKPWADEDGTILNNYSKQFRYSEGIRGEYPYEVDSCDQIQYLINAMKNHPFSRRTVATTWHPYDMTSNSFTPITNCHGTVIQMFVNPDNKAHMVMYQRSCDMLLGVPHNWIQYWALLMWLCHKSGKDVGTFTWIGGDCHVYEDHFELAEEMIDASNSRLNTKRLNEIPKLIYTPSNQNFKASDFSLDQEYIPLINKSAKMIV